MLRQPAILDSYKVIESKRRKLYHNVIRHSKLRQELQGGRAQQLHPMFVDCRWIYFILRRWRVPRDVIVDHILGSNDGV